MTVPLHCRCLDQRKDSGALVLCEICDRWFHESCVTVKLPAAKVDDGIVEEEESFVCRDCHKGTTDVLVRHGEDSAHHTVKVFRGERDRPIIVFVSDRTMHPFLS